LKLVTKDHISIPLDLISKPGIAKGASSVYKVQTNQMLYQDPIVMVLKSILIALLESSPSTSVNQFIEQYLYEEVKRSKELTVTQTIESSHPHSCDSRTAHFVKVK
jgi:hypothetical protein